MVIVTLLVVLIIGLALLSPEKPTEPNMIGVFMTDNIYKTALSLKSNLEQPTDNKKRIMLQYVDYMDAMTDDCRALATAYNQQIKAGGTGDTTILLQNSAALCKDLMRLTETSSSIYHATLPLLTTSPTVKRYQTLPLIKNRVISNHRSSTETAIKKLTASEQSDEDYVKLALSMTKELHRSMQDSKGFNYLPALDKYQRQMIADRQQFWTNYGDLNKLIPALKNQLIQYCNNAPANKPAPSQCQELTNT
jgi:hypothetical protein